MDSLGNVDGGRSLQITRPILKELQGSEVGNLSSGKLCVQFPVRDFGRTSQYNGIRWISESSPARPTK